MRNPHHVGIVFDDDDEDEQKTILCPMCEKLGYRGIMGPKIIFAGQEKQPDHDDWKQCDTCGWLCPIYESKYEQALEPFAETTDNPFDEQKGQVVGVARRSSPAGKRASEKRKRERNRPHHKDKEIDELLRIYGDGVKIVFDSNP
jgi:hypothetical protein